MNVPFINLKKLWKSVGAPISLAINKVARDGQFINNESKAEFQAAWAKRCGKDFAILVNSCTDAIEMSLRSLYLPPHSKVLVQANSFIATADAVVRTGHNPVFMDCDEYGQPDIGIIHNFLTQDKTIKAVIVVHLYGDYTDITPLLAFEGVTIIEDCAHSHGHKPLSDLACFSFYPGKNLGGIADGGAIVTNNVKRARILKMMGDHGRDTVLGVSKCIGMNSRMSAINATALLHKLHYLNGWIDKRKWLAKRYHKYLSKYFKTNYTESNNFHLFVILTKKRDELQQYLKDCRIDTSIHYSVPISKQPVFHKYFSYPTPNADKRAQGMLSLPMCPYLGIEEQNYVIEKCITWCKKNEV